MAHPQNSPRGLVDKSAATFAAATITDATITTETVTTATITTLKIGAAGIQTFTTDATRKGLIFGAPLAAKPTTDGGAQFSMVSNSTGVALVVNTTGTTWKYLNVTSVQPT